MVLQMCPLVLQLLYFYLFVIGFSVINIQTKLRFSSGKCNFFSMKRDYEVGIPTNSIER